MDSQELNQLVDSIQPYGGDIKSVRIEEGMIAYRKFLWALWFIERRVKKLKNYKQEVISSIDDRIANEEEAIDRIRKQIEYALENDPIAEKTKNGGRKLILPDIATVSISKVSDKLIIEDAEAVLEALGEDGFGKIKVSLDTTKAKQYLKDKPAAELPTGARKEKSRTFSVRFKR